MSKGELSTNNTRRPRKNTPVWEEKMIDAFQNGMWSSVFKYDYINLMFAEGDLSVDHKGETVSCRPIVIPLYTVHTRRFKTDHVHYFNHP